VTRLFQKGLQLVRLGFFFQVLFPQDGKAPLFFGVGVVPAEGEGGG